MSDSYVFAGCKPWYPPLFEEISRQVPGEWHFAASPEDVTPERVAALAPRYLFFVHWSWKVPPEIFERFECVGFHLGDVPRGRGGSPLQNHILRGRRGTMLSALRMVEELDAGPVYLKEPCSLEGGAEEIYLRQARLACDMIRRICREQPDAQPQQGDPEVFRRRKPAQSRLPENLPDLGSVHDFVRMLDADGYPKAFLDFGGFRFELSRGALYHGRLRADVTITRLEEPEE